MLDSVKPYWETFEVPVAWDSFREPHPVFPSDACKHVKYYCPECRGAVQLRSGSKIRPHFYHVNPNATCSSEGIIHQAAKALLLYWINSGHPLRIAYHCPQCHHEGSYSLPFPNGLTAIQEYQVEPYRGDVVLVDTRGHPHGDLEILSSHPVDDQKATYLPVPWAEFEAELILKCPTVLWPIRSGGGWPQPTDCDHCRPHWIPIDPAVRMIRAKCPRFKAHDVHETICANCRFHQRIHEGSDEIPHVHCSFLPSEAHKWKDETAKMLQEIQTITYRHRNHWKWSYHRGERVRGKNAPEVVELTKEQQQIIAATDSILRVTAYAGTGKTFTLSEMVKINLTLKFFISRLIRL